MQHDRPDNGVEADDLLADEMDVRRPVLLIEAVVLGTVAQRVDVVGQRVNPDVHGMVGVKVNRDAPLDRRAGNAQILQARNQEVVEHLRRAGSRLNEVRMLLDVVDHPVLILGETEEIALLTGLLHRAAAVRAAAILELQLRPEGLARRAVQALILALVDVALIVQLPEDLLDGLDVALVRGADEVVILHVHQLPEVLDARDDLVDIGLWGHASRGGLALDLLAVLVRAGQEEDVVAGLLLEARHGVGGRRAVAVADMQIIAGIIDRRSDVECRFLAHVFLSLKNVPRCKARDEMIVVPP